MPNNLPEARLNPQAYVMTKLALNPINLDINLVNLVEIGLQGSFYEFDIFLGEGPAHMGRGYRRRIDFPPQSTEILSPACQ